MKGDEIYETKNKRFIRMGSSDAPGNYIKYNIMRSIVASIFSRINSVLLCKNIISYGGKSYE